MSDFATPIRIRAQAMARDPQTMRFLLDAPLREGRSLRLDRPIDGPTGGPTGGPTSGPNGGPRAAPLAQALFGVAGVQRVQVDGASIVVTCAPTVDWDRMKAPIAAAIRSALAGTAPPLGDPSAGIEAAAEDDAALLEAVTELLDARANPSIAGHGDHAARGAADDPRHRRCHRPLGRHASLLPQRRWTESALQTSGSGGCAAHRCRTHRYRSRVPGQQACHVGG
jgi:hypothetical protein